MTNEAKLLIAFIAMLILLSLGTDNLSAQNILSPDTPTWRLVSSLQTTAWSWDMNGGSSETQIQNYYTGSSSTLPDSTVEMNWSHVSSVPSVWVYQYYYTDLPDYYEKLSVMRSRPYFAGNGSRELERFDYAHRPLLYVKTRGPDPDGEELFRNEYSYDADGNLLQKIEYLTKYQQVYGPKKVIRYSYRPDGKILTQYEYTVINNDLEDLQLDYNDKRFYNTEGLMVAKVSRNFAYASIYYGKYLLNYNPYGLEYRSRSYSSSDSLNWQIAKSKETTYDVSFGEYKPFRIDYYTHMYDDSTSFFESYYDLYSYLDLNRDVSIVNYNSDGSSSGSSHYVYNEGLKLVLSNSNSEDSDGYSISRHAEYVWETVVSNADLVQAIPGFALSVYPNPFRATSKICYSLKEPGPVKLELFNLRGQKVKTLISASKAAGKHEMDMDISDLNLASGVYILRASSNDSSTGRKLMLIK